MHTTNGISKFLMQKVEEIWPTGKVLDVRK
jgi:hypothetical protein